MSETDHPQFPVAARVLSLSDCGQASAFFNQWDGRFEQISAGRFEGTLHVVSSGRVRVMDIQCNQRTRVTGNDRAGVLTITPVIGSNEASLWQGHQLDPRRIVLNGVDSDVNHFTAKSCESRSLSLRPEVLEAAARSVLAVDSVTVPRTWAAIQSTPESFADFQFHLVQLLRRGLADRTFLGTAECHRYEQECLRSIAVMLFAQSTRNSPVSAHNRLRLVHRAEEFMRSHLSAPIGAIDLCRELGANDRTLRLAFRERYGLGPMAYFKHLRLNAVRSRLKSTPHLSVSAAAREFGFHHLGNFSADYRKLFKESPGKTRRHAEGS